MTFKMIKRMNRLREIESRHINIGCWLFYLMAIMMPPLKAFAEAVPPTNTSSDDQAACVTINNIELSHLYAFPNAANLKELASDVYGLCLGEQGLLSLLAKLQSQLVVDGYITSRVALADEHYNDGTLYLKLILVGLKVSNTIKRALVMFISTPFFPVSPVSWLICAILSKG